MVEVYKKCFENYEVSNLGNIRRELHNGEYRNIKGSIMNKGYRYFQIFRKGKRLNKLVHQMVYRTFKDDKIIKGYHIDHIDRNKLNNNINNLRYITHKENMRNTDRYKHHIKEQGKERIAILNKEWAELNKEKCINNNKIYYENNKERIKENSKIWKNNNKDKAIKSNKIWKKNNREKVRQNERIYENKNRKKINSRRRERYQLNKVIKELYNIDIGIFLE